MATAATPALPGRPLVLADLVPGAKVRDIALVAAGVLLTALLAQVAVPVPNSPVPISGATLAVVLVAAGLGPARGVTSMAVYAILGLVGLPFFAEASGGYQVVLGATGGYIVGYLPAAFLIGLAARRGMDRAPWKALPLFIAGQLVVFVIGVPWLAVAADLSASQAVAAGFTPFLLGGLVKSAVAAVLLPGAWLVARGLRD